MYIVLTRPQGDNISKEDMEMKYGNQVLQLYSREKRLQPVQIIYVYFHFCHLSILKKGILPDKKKYYYLTGIIYAIYMIF